MHTLQNSHDPEERGEYLNQAWSQVHQSCGHEDYKVKKRNINSTNYSKIIFEFWTFPHFIKLSWYSNTPKRWWRPVVRACTSRVLSKQLSVFISGGKRSPGGLDSQGLPGFTHNFCTCPPQSIVPWIEGATYIRFSLHRTHVTFVETIVNWLQYLDFIMPVVTGCLTGRRTIKKQG